MQNDINGEEFTGDFIEHYGVKGMKWGVLNAKASVQAGRAGLEAQKRQITSATTAEAIDAAQAKYNAMRADHLNNPDRVTAQTMTLGKAATVSALGFLALGPVGIPVGLAAQAAYRKTIRKRQATGYYDRKG